MNQLFSPEIQHAVRTHGWAKLRAATRRRIREAEKILRQPIAATAGGPLLRTQFGLLSKTLRGVGVWRGDRCRVPRVAWRRAV
jgi:hypothetical protein